MNFVNLKKNTHTKWKWQWQQPHTLKLLQTKNSLKNYILLKTTKIVLGRKKISALRIDRKNQIILPKLISAEFDIEKLNFLEIMTGK